MAATAQKNTKTQLITTYHLQFKNLRTFRTWHDPDYRLSRPIKSVALDKTTKQDILKGIEEFLDPGFALTCQENGIPWRCGYLFHGPPGTGKTSFVKAIATYFGLPIYLLSLQDSKMDDTGLQHVFTTFQQRSIVLIEDLDRISVACKKSKEMNSIQDDPRHEDAKCSLAGLLNSIDGVATSEGHILIATSNRPELLNEALTRPGRIDRRVEFALYTKDLAMQMFANMFREKQTNRDALAEQFRDLIPEGKLSPATIQEFLLATSPKEAIARASVYDSSAGDS